jgi:hypothetical protein
MRVIDACTSTLSPILKRIRKDKHNQENAEPRPNALHEAENRLRIPAGNADVSGLTGQLLS